MTQPAGRPNPWVALTMAVLVLVGWLGPVFVSLFVPAVTVSEEHAIEAGGAFGIFYLLVVPYVAASLWVVPSSLAAMALAALTDEATGPARTR